MKFDILLTGGSGFLGKQIYNYLETDYNLRTVSRNNADYNIDLANGPFNLNHKFDIVVHAAGKAHVVANNNKQSQTFFDVNVNGTINLLKTLENAGLPKYFVYISSVSVYGKEEGELIPETHPLQASDPYGKSKIEAEAIVQEWSDANNVKCSILRLPLIAGINPPGNLKSMIVGIKRGYYFNISGNDARKSIVLAQDIAKIIPIAAKNPGIYNLTDGYHPTFSELSMLIAKLLNKKNPRNMPIRLARVLAKFGDLLGPNAPFNSNKLKKIVSVLTFDDSRARALLGWNPMLVLDEFKLK